MPIHKRSNNNASKKRVSKSKKAQEITEMKRSNAISFLALIISVISLLSSTWPFNPLNKNLEARAESGSVDAQMKLADYSLDIGDYKKSIYWYTIAVSSKGNHQAKAYNNIGYIYVKNPDLSILTPDYYLRTLNYFQQAIELDSTDAMRNEYIFLKSFPEEVFSDVSYSNILEDVARQLQENGNFTEDLQVYSTGWKKETTICDHSAFEDLKKEYGDDTVFISVPSKTETKIVGDGVQVVAYYDVYRKVENAEIPTYVRTK